MSLRKTRSKAFTLVELLAPRAVPTQVAEQALTRMRTDDSN